MLEVTANRSLPESEHSYKTQLSSISVGHLLLSVRPLKRQLPLKKKGCLLSNERSQMGWPGVGVRWGQLLLPDGPHIYWSCCIERLFKAPLRSYFMVCAIHLRVLTKTVLIKITETIQRLHSQSTSCPWLQVMIIMITMRSHL